MQPNFDPSKYSEPDDGGPEVNPKMTELVEVNKQEHDCILDDQVTGWRVPYKHDKKATAPSALPIKFNVVKSAFSSGTLMKILSGVDGVTKFTTTEAKSFKSGRFRPRASDERGKAHFERVISFPEEIPQAKTEYEEVVYCQRTKLFHLLNGN